VAPARATQLINSIKVHVDLLADARAFIREPTLLAASWIANGTQRCLILEPRNDILRWIPYTRLTFAVL
jgi:hypothetical protein